MPETIMEEQENKFSLSQAKLEKQRIKDSPTSKSKDFEEKPKAETSKIKEEEVIVPNSSSKAQTKEKQQAETPKAEKAKAEEQRIKDSPTSKSKDFEGKPKAKGINIKKAKVKRKNLKKKEKKLTN